MGHRLVARRGREYRVWAQFRSSFLPMAPSAGSPGVPASVEDAARAAHARYAPAPVYVVDIAEHQGDFRVVELNTFNSADLYACEVERVIDDVTRIAGRL